MPRNGMGGYALPSPPSPFQNGTTANAPDVMTVLNDVASTLTDSVAADGQTPMTGALNMNNQSINSANAIAGKSLTLNGVALSALTSGYISGLTLSNDSGTPNTVLDIAAGVCVDSAAAVFIRIASAFTKNTSGSWAAGSGNAGMGQGLTIANSTWYHVFAILNAGAADIYFDTSVSAANAPVGTTAFRRIGSFFTDSSAHILPFVQFGDTFIWGAPGHDINAFASSQTSSLKTLGSVPPGVQVDALLYAGGVNSAGAVGFLLSAPDATSVSGAGLAFFSFFSPAAAVAAWAQLRIRTDTSQNIRVVSSANINNTVQGWTYGWVDSRGKA